MCIWLAFRMLKPAPRTQLWDSNVSLKPSERHMWLRWGKTSIETFNILAGGYRELLICTHPRQALKKVCLLTKCATYQSGVVSLFLQFFAPVQVWGIVCEPTVEQVIEKEKLSLVSIWFCIICRHHPQVDSWSTAAPIQEGPEGRHWWENFPVGRTSSSTTGYSFSLEGEKTGGMDRHKFMDCGSITPTI